MSQSGEKDLILLMLPALPSRGEMTFNEKIRLGQYYKKYINNIRQQNEIST